MFYSSADVEADGSAVRTSARSEIQPIHSGRVSDQTAELQQMKTVVATKLDTFNLNIIRTESMRESMITR